MSDNYLEILPQIDLCYFELNQLNEQLQKPRSPLEKQIDEVTGYSASQIKVVKRLMKRIIRLKKKIEADYSYDETFLDKIIALENESKEKRGNTRTA